MIVVAGMVPEQGDAAIMGNCDAVNHRMVNYFSWMRATSNAKSSKLTGKSIPS